jgi:hypothetical protein
MGGWIRFVPLRNVKIFWDEILRLHHYKRGGDSKLWQLLTLRKLIYFYHDDIPSKKYLGDPSYLTSSRKKSNFKLKKANLVINNHLLIKASVTLTHAVQLLLAVVPFFEILVPRESSVKVPYNHLRRNILQINGVLLRTINGLLTCE